MAKRRAPTWSRRHKQWLRYVEAWIGVFECGEKIPLGPAHSPLDCPDGRRSAGEVLNVVICSPHPDDEGLIGGLPLRLRLEAGARVTNVAITLGSKLDQRPRRLRELESSCRVLGFGLEVAEHPSGLENVNLKNRDSRPEEWRAKVETLAALFDRFCPDVVFAPHAEDWNSTHGGTHYLAVDALGLHLERSARGPVPLILTEFWHELGQPNLMVGLRPEIVATELMATAEHGGEVRRNPYHLRQPARLMNNVRRGSEVVGGQGGPAHRFPFAELYRVAFMRGRELQEPAPGGLVIGPKQKVSLESIVERFLAKP